LGHDAQALLAPFTAQPAPDLHAACVCVAPSCHWPLGQLVHAMLAVVEHAEDRLLPVPHVPHVLHDALPASF